MNRRWYQFSMQAFLAFVAGVGIAIAMIRHFPHVVIFIVSLGCFILACRSTYRSARASRLRLSLVFALASTVTFVVLYALSMGPFIALSELEDRIGGHNNLKRVSVVYRPVMVLYSGRFMWYVDKWISPNAAGLRATLPPDDSLRPLVGTWEGAKGNVMNFRPDGSARYRSSSGTELGYFEWTVSNNEFVLWQYGSQHSASAWFGRHMMEYTPTERFLVGEILEDQFQLRDSAGKPHRFRRTHDADLEMLP
jgi:hypothetical protein